MIPEVHACSGYLVITGPKRAYRDNAGALCPWWTSAQKWVIRPVLIQVVLTLRSFSSAATMRLEATGVPVELPLEDGWHLSLGCMGAVTIPDLLMCSKPSGCKGCREGLCERACQCWPRMT